MSSRAFIIGLLLAGTLLQGTPALAQTPLYDRIKADIEAENEEDRAVVSYIRGWMKDKEDLTLSEEEVRKMLKGDLSGTCGEYKPADKLRPRLGCSAAQRIITVLASDADRIRETGRELQRIATSYELPISILSARPFQLSRDFQAVTSIWAAGSGNVLLSQSGSILRFLQPDADLLDALREKMDDLGEALEILPQEERIAAVWRYQYGVRYARNDRAPAFERPPEDVDDDSETSERRLLVKHWDDVEDALGALWPLVNERVYDPPITGKTVLVINFPAEYLRAHLPDNVTFWARIDVPEAHPLGDVGLQWQVPLFPAYPALTTDDGTAIAGGDYPPDPVDGDGLPIDGTGLCSDATQQRGYLCRRITATKGKCPPPPGDNPSDILLTPCIETGSLRTTIAGPDVCREVNYRDDAAAFDPQTQCTFNVLCQPDCAFNAGPGIDAVTKVKDANGVIEICMKEELQGDVQPLMLHEMHHALQFCHLPPGPMYTDVPAGPPSERRRIIDENKALCCQSEYEGYHVQNDITDFPPDESVLGVPMNAETMAEYMQDVSCRAQKNPFFGGEEPDCPKSRTYPPNFEREAGKWFSDTILTNTKKVNCADLFDTIGGQRKLKDPLLRDMQEMVQRHTDVCKPGTTQTFLNRIGNNMCFVGQCIEESLELHRVQGGRNPAGVQDEAFPYDSPLAGGSLAQHLQVLADQPVQFPPYRPANIIHQIELATCQLTGNPPLTPPIRCAIDSYRRLSAPSTDFLTTTQGIASDSLDAQQWSLGEMTLPLSLASRIGTDLYADFLQSAGGQLASVLRTAAQLFTDITKVRFPSEMCPMSLPSP